MVKITLEMYGNKYSVETDNSDALADGLIELFTRLLVVAGFSPSVIRLPEDEGRYEYVGENEEVVERKDED